jgi:phage terminase Nu1 subunit (DNA packaging protein)
MAENLIDLNDFCHKFLQDRICSPRRYRQLADEGLCPKVKAGKVDGPTALRDLLFYYNQLAQNSGSISLTDERKRKTRLEADRKELDLERMRGEVISTTRAMSLWGSVCFQIRSKILAIPTKIAPLIFSLKTIPEIKERLEVAVHEVLNELASPDLEQIARMDGRKPDLINPKSAGKVKRQPVVRRKKVSKPGK